MPGTCTVHTRCSCCLEDTVCRAAAMTDLHIFSWGKWRCVQLTAHLPSFPSKYFNNFAFCAVFLLWRKKACPYSDFLPLYIMHRVEWLIPVVTAARWCRAVGKKNCLKKNPAVGPDFVRVLCPYIFASWPLVRTLPLMPDSATHRYG